MSGKDKEKVKGNVQDFASANLLAHPLNAAGDILAVADTTSNAGDNTGNQGSINLAELNGRPEIEIEVVAGEKVPNSDDSSLL